MKAASKKMYDAIMYFCCIYRNRFVLPILKLWKPTIWIISFFILWKSKQSKF